MAKTIQPVEPVEKRGAQASRFSRSILARLASSAEAYTAVKLILWGAFVSAPGTSFASESARRFAEAAPELFHGSVTLVVGLFLLACFERREKRFKQARRVLLFMGLVCWLYVAIQYGRSNFWSTATISYSIDGALAILGYTRVSNFKTVKAQIRFDL